MTTNETTWRSGRYAVVDVEGNGAPTPDLVELAIVHVDDGTIGDVVSWLVKPDQKIAHRVTRIHGITNADVASAPKFEEIASEVRRQLEGRLIVAHQATVDYGVLKRKMPDWSPEALVDTLRLARSRHPGLPSYALSALQRHFALDVVARKGEAPHRAGYDAQLAAELLVRLADDPAAGGIITMAELLQMGRVDLPPVQASPAQGAMF